MMRLPSLGKKFRIRSEAATRLAHSIIRKARIPFEVVRAFLSFVKDLFVGKLNFSRNLQ